MKKELKTFAKEMQKLNPDDRLYWLQSMSHCRAIGLSPTTWPARFYKSFIRLEEDYRHFKGIIVDSLSALLTDKKEELPVVKKGVDAFMWASDKERKEFYKAVQTTPYQKATRIADSSDRREMYICRHNQKIKAIIIFAPSAKKSVRTRE